MKKNFIKIKLTAIVLFLFIILSYSCKKDDDNNSSNNNNPTGNTFTDPRDGYVYHTITIGTQVWMVENLHYLPGVAGSGTTAVATPYYYVQGYNGTNVTEAKATANYKTYGVLYNWKAAKTACPTGWHLPSDAEWTVLTTYLGGIAVAGGKLKEKGTTHWNSPNTGATNETGFTAFPGGNISFNGTFDGFGNYGYWWSSTEEVGNNAWSIGLNFDQTYVVRYPNFQQLGFSVRCLKN